MLPTLQIGQRVVVDRLSHRLGSSPHVGDIIVFHPPRGAEAQPERCAAAAQGRGTQTPCSRPWGGPAKVTYIKRVVGLPGDRIAIHNGRVIRNGRPLDVANATSCPGLQSCDLEHPITVPAGSFFVMGDNRGASDDSRFWGPVPKGWIIGRAFASYWPAGRIGSL
jgi:signal peptidase I